MTGFGRGVAERAGVRATLDLRAVNHRFLDLKVRGAVPAAVEDAIATRVRAAIERGAVAVSIHVVRTVGSTASQIDRAAAERAHAALASLAAHLALPPPDLALVLAQPGVIVGDEVDPVADDGLAAAAGAALELALGQLEQMRVAEGRALAVDLGARLDTLAAARAQLAALAAALPNQLARRLHERIRRLLEDVEPDPVRLAQEVAVYADRADISEELVRLGSHLDQARALIGGTATGAVGRRLDFLVQEIGRELNTIGSKSALAEISAAIVEAKATLEKIREQVQNVE